MTVTQIETTLREEMVAVRWSPGAKRGLLSVAAVWVIFWSLYPTFGRPAAMRAIIRKGAHELEACDPIMDASRGSCYVAAGTTLNRALGAMTFRSEYVGYAPVWLGVGLGAPLLLLLVMKRKRVRAA